MVMGFPVHKMYTPPSFPPAALHKLGGNAMHVRCVGAALLIGLCLVDVAKLHWHFLVHRAVRAACPTWCTWHSMRVPRAGANRAPPARREGLPSARGTLLEEA